MTASFRFAIWPLILTIFCFPAFAQETQDGSEIIFDNPQHNFGDVAEGTKVSHTFKFKNAGNQPLVITNVVSTCGCTTTAWPKEPVPPGKSGEIRVEFDLTGRRGPQSKVITVISNSHSPQARLKIIANVLPGNT